MLELVLLFLPMLWNGQERQDGLGPGYFLYLLYLVLTLSKARSFSFM